jgi:hypothetical protein
LLTVVSTRCGLGGPFLLEESPIRGGWGAESLQVIQVIFAPRLTDFLGSQMLAVAWLIEEQKMQLNLPP